MNNLASATGDNVSINYEDIPKISNLTKMRKNPFADSINEKGYSIVIHYSPDDVANGKIDDSKDIAQALIELMSVSDVKRLLLHIKDNYDLPCSPTVWETVDSL